MSVVEEVARKLDGPSVLGRDVHSQADLALAVRERLPLVTLKGLAQAGLTVQEIERLVIPRRTRRHRADKDQPLTIEESDRAVRLLRIQTVAEDAFGSREKGQYMASSGSRCARYRDHTRKNRMGCGCLNDPLASVGAAACPDIRWRLWPLA